MATAEQRSLENIDRLLTAAGWSVQDFNQADIHAARGVALREFQLNSGFGEADHLRYVDGKAAGVIEAKKEGATVTGAEVESSKCAQGLPTRRWSLCGLRQTASRAKRREFAYA